MRRAVAPVFVVVLAALAVAPAAQSPSAQAPSAVAPTIGSRGIPILTSRRPQVP